MLDLSRTIPLYPALWYENPVRDICIQRSPSPQASNATQASPTLSHQPQNPNGTDTVGGDNNDENEEKASHLRICPKDSLIWTSGFWSVPLQKKIVFRENGSKLWLPKIISPLYCQLQDSSSRQVELPGQIDLLCPGLLNQDARSTSKVCCWTLGHIIDVPQLVPHASTTSQGPTNQW